MYRFRIVKYKNNEKFVVDNKKLVVENFIDNTIENVANDDSEKIVVLNLIENAIKKIIVVCDVSEKVNNFDVIVKNFETMIANNIMKKIIKNVIENVRENAIAANFDKVFCIVIVATEKLIDKNFVEIAFVKNEKLENEKLTAEVDARIFESETLIVENFIENAIYDVIIDCEINKEVDIENIIVNELNEKIFVVVNERLVADDKKLIVENLKKISDKLIEKKFEKLNDEFAFVENEKSIVEKYVNEALIDRNFENNDTLIVESDDDV